VRRKGPFCRSRLRAVILLPLLPALGSANEEMGLGTVLARHESSSQARGASNGNPPTPKRKARFRASRAGGTTSGAGIIRAGAFRRKEPSAAGFSPFGTSVEELHPGSYSGG